MSTGKLYNEGLTIEELFPDDSIQEHVKSSDMWAGALVPIDTVEYIVGHDDTDGLAAPNIYQAEISYPPALYKCVDEALVNAVDNTIRLIGTPGDNQTTRIDFNFDSRGRVTVKNNGMGVPVGWHEKAQKYSVELIFGVMFKGRKKIDKQSKITGDENRVGIKIANIMSTEFTVTTVYMDPNTKKRTKYQQTWRNSMRDVEKPIITNDVKEAQYTEVTFVLDYKDTFKTPLTPSYYKQLNSLFHFRAYQAASYVGYYTKGKCTMYYNGRLVSVKNMSEFARIVYPSSTVPVMTTTVGKDTEHPWEVTIAVAPNTASNKKGVASISNVNGIAVKTGRHIDALLDQIIEGVKTAITKRLKTSADIKFQPSYVYSNIHIFANTQIPGVRWTGQRKDEAICDGKKLTNHKLIQSYINKLSTALEGPIVSSIYDKDSVIGVEKTRRDPLKVEKYEKARLSGQGRGKQPQKCSLLLPEGDSAASMCQNGLTYKPTKNSPPLLGMDYYGIMTLRGVIVNVRKKVEIKEVSGRRVLSLTKDLATNDFFRAFTEAIGLDLNAKYDPTSSTYKKEFAALNYGCIIACVDQDHDGSGFIFPLLVNIFELLWPELLKSGFVKKWDTPRRRAYPKGGGKVIEFYSEHQYNQWVKSDPDNHNMSKYNFEYIKGLGGHEDEAVIGMFKKFHDNVITYYPDKQSAEAFEIMFGRSSDPRKDWLKTTIEPPNVEAVERRDTEKTASCTELIHHEGKEHALCNLGQKLWSSIDGMNESGRKILDGSIKFFANRAEKVKLVTLQGYITQHEHYQHGEASMHESMCGKAFICVGGVQLPQLLPKGNFGSRKQGGEDHAQVRYIYTLLNKKLTKLLYPAEDYPNYKFVYEDGERAEPQYFVPILPTATLESVHMPAHGWKIQTWARDVFSVISKVRMLINSYDDERPLDMVPIAEIPPESRGFKGEFRYVRGKLHCFGNYIYDEATRTITITELPLRVWHGSYVEKLTETRGYYTVTPKTKTTAEKTIRMFKETPRNQSSNEYINIQIELENPDKSTGIDPLDVINNYTDGHWADGFEEYFDLHVPMTDNLSMISTEGSVVVFDSYEDILRYWFPVRKEFYAKRVKRALVLMEIEIQFLENIIRYVDEYKKLKISNIADSMAIGILSQHSYDRFNRGLLRSKGHVTSPVDKYLSTDELKSAIINSPEATYDYLLDTTDRDKLQKATLARQQKLERLIKERDDLIAKANKGKFIGAIMWLEELTEIEDVIRKGFATNWQFSDYGKFKFE